MKSAGKARNNGLYRHIRTSKEIIRNLLNDSKKKQRIKNGIPLDGKQHKMVKIVSIKDIMHNIEFNRLFVG